MSNILEMKNIRKTFLGGNIVANDNVNLTLNKGEVLSIVGENGSGKSTLMNILFGMYKQDSGKIFINNKEVDMYSSGAASRYKIGMVHQHFHLVDKFTVLENVLIGQETIKRDKKEVINLKELGKEIKVNLNQLISSFDIEQKNKYLRLIKIDKDISFLMDQKTKKYHIIALNPFKENLKSNIKEEIKTINSNLKNLSNEKDKILLDKDIKATFLTFVELERNKYLIKTSNTTSVGILNKKAIIRRFKNITKEYGIKLMYDQRTGDLSVGDRQKVEILKVLWQEKNIIVFDEPTATLSVDEIKDFQKLVKLLQSKGVSIIFISHKLPEVKILSNRVVILNKGKFLGEFKNDAKLTIKKIANLMVGANVTLKYPDRKISSKNSLVVKNLSLTDEISGKKILDSISFNVKENEVFGLAGIEGNGQEEILEIISGLTKPDSGIITFKGRDLTNLTIKERNTFISHIPTDRFKHGMVSLADLKFNSILSLMHEGKFTKQLSFWKANKSLVDYSKVDAHTDKIIERMNVEGAFSHLIPIKDLSGGNQQKFVVGRELEKEHELLLAGHPTRGLDIKAIDNIYKNIIDNAKNNKATILFSLEITELLAACDRLAIFHEGKIVKIIKPNNKEDVKKIPLYMVGEKK